MTAKRFKLRLSKLGNGMITDTQKRKDLYFDKEFLNTTLPKANEWLNELAEENQELKRLVKATVEDYTDLKKSFDLIDKENEQLQSLNKYLIELLERNGATVEIEKVKRND